MTNDRRFTYLLATTSEFSTIIPSRILGIEITDPTLAERCGLGNIDPQHRPGAQPISPAAIEACLRIAPPKRGTCLATIRPDADSIGSMALLELRAAGATPSADMLARITEIAAADRNDRGAWPGRGAFPGIEDKSPQYQPDHVHAVLSACASDRNTTLEKRVTAFMRFLCQGTLPEAYHVSVEDRRNALARSLTTGATRASLVAGGRIAVVISMEPGVLSLGYRLAPIVVALNPAWEFPSGEVGRKYTVARWHEDDANLTTFESTVAAIEPGWGGQAGIKGSPQNRPSTLTVEKILALLKTELGFADVSPAQINHREVRSDPD